MSSESPYFKNAYEHLETLIQERQQFEASHPWHPYDTQKTDINYTDMKKNSLLHYAAARGNLEKVKECIEKGADINLKSTVYDLNALGIALNCGHIDVANYLYEHKANCFTMPAETCKTKEAKEWFNEKIKIALYQTYPKPEEDFQDGKKSNRFFKKKMNLSLNTFKQTKNNIECTNSLIRAAEIGDLDFIIKAKKKDEKKVNSELNALLISAVVNDQMEVVKWTLENGAKINNDRRYSENALQKAINFNLNMVDYLLEHGADINKQNGMKTTPLMTAAKLNDPKLMEKLLEKKPNLSLRDIDGDNIFHYLAYSGQNPAVIEQLLALPEAKSLLKEKNIYGYTAYDLAVQNKKDTLIQLFAPEKDLNEIKKSSQYGEVPIYIWQNAVRQKMSYFLRSQYRLSNYFELEGHCNGFSYLHQIYADQGKEDYFFSTLALMSQWDGKDSSLNEPFKDIPQAKYYKNLGELFEQWINDTIWFQQTGPEKFIDDLKQTDRIKQHFIIHGPEDFRLFYLHNAQAEAQKQSLAELKTLLNYLLRMPPRMHFEIHGDEHVTSIYKNDQGKLLYYDPNFHLKTTSLENSEQLLQRLIDHKYISLKEIFDETGEHSMVAPAIQSFFYKKDFDLLLSDLNNFNVFSDDELPKSQEEAKRFQLNTPGNYSPLHIAVITTSQSSLKKLLSDNYCDINARDAHGLTALDIATKNGVIGYVNLFLNGDNRILMLDEKDEKPVSIDQQTLALQKKNGNLIAYWKENDKIIEKSLEEKEMTADILSELSAIVGESKDNNLMQKIASKYGCTLFTNPPVELNEAPVIAYLNNHHEILQLLLNYKNSQDLNNLLYVVIQDHDEAMVKWLIAENKVDINKPDSDERGRNAPIHYAATHYSAGIIKELLRCGADPNQKDLQGKSALDRLNDTTCITNNCDLRVITAVPTLVNLPQLKNYTYLLVQPDPEAPPTALYFVNIREATPTITPLTFLQDKDISTFTTALFPSVDNNVYTDIPNLSMPQLQAITSITGHAPNAKQECFKLLLPLINFDLSNEADRNKVFTLLSQNIESPDNDLFKLILQKCDKNILNMRSMNDGEKQYDIPLLSAVRKGQLTKVQLLLESGANVDAITTDGDTALAQLIKSDLEKLPQKYQLIQLLLNYHPNLDLCNEKNEKHENALDLIENSNEFELKQIFIDHNLIKPKINMMACR